MKLWWTRATTHCEKPWANSRHICFPLQVRYIFAIGAKGEIGSSWGPARIPLGQRGQESHGRVGEESGYVKLPIYLCHTRESLRVDEE